MRRCVQPPVRRGRPVAAAALALSWRPRFGAVRPAPQNQGFESVPRPPGSIGVPTQSLLPPGGGAVLAPPSGPAANPLVLAPPPSQPAALPNPSAPPPAAPNPATVAAGRPDGAGRAGGPDGFGTLWPRAAEHHRRPALARLRRPAGCQRRVPHARERARGGPDLRAAARRLCGACELRPRERGQEGAVALGNRARKLRTCGRRARASKAVSATAVSRPDR